MSNIWTILVVRVDVVLPWNDGSALALTRVARAARATRSELVVAGPVVDPHP
jgi:hypothetical protein